MSDLTKEGEKKVEYVINTYLPKVNLRLMLQLFELLDGKVNDWLEARIYFSVKGDPGLQVDGQYSGQGGYYYYNLSTTFRQMLPSTE